MDANGWTEIACGSNDRKSIQLVVTQVLEEAGIPVKRETIVPAVSFIFVFEINCTWAAHIYLSAQDQAASILA